LQRFLYVLDGELTVGEIVLSAGGYAYLPPGSAGVSTTSNGRAAVIEKPYVPMDGVAQPSVILKGLESNLVPQPLMGDPDLEVRSMIPAAPAFDFAVNTMSFRPGAALAMVEVHVMEHGLLFLAGGGIYRLGDCWYPVTKGDFIYMAPYCPQWFGALGKEPSKYLIYKDWNRVAV
jgi:(S)-ureidoglycine aminohydrolase